MLERGKTMSQDGKAMWGEFWDAGAWCLFDDSDKNIILKHPYEAGERVACPYCEKVLRFENNTAMCCEERFRAYPNEVRQARPVGTHTHARGGWQTLRPYRRADAVAVPIKKTMPTPRTGRVLKFG
jgi:hypothetical protein